MLLKFKIMLESIDIKQILFFDIETVSQHPTFDLLEERMKELWKIKTGHLLHKNLEDVTDEDCQSTYKAKAAIFAEFGKIICISVGAVALVNGEEKIRLKSFSSENETEVLENFKALIDKKYKDAFNQYLCGHNIKEFDVPYICRRMIIHGMRLPHLFDLHGKKPWETKHLLDTMDLWKFGDGKSFTSIKLLTAVLDIPSPKDDIDGSMVGKVFWEEKGLDRITHYCEKDVLATAQVFRRFTHSPLFSEEQVIVVE